MSNVVPLGDTVLPGEAVESIVELLEELLALAVAGELRAFSYALSREGEISTGWEGVAGSRNDLAAAIMALQHRFVASFVEG